jgi:hypothetical protein
MIRSLARLRWSRLAGATLLPLALALALLPSAGSALAAATRTPLNGVEQKAFTTIPVSRSWDAGPWHLDHDITVIGTFDFGALAGTVVWVANDRLDFTSGDGRIWGKATYTANSGIVCEGTAQGKLTGFLVTAKIVAPCSDGSLLKGTLQDVSNNGAILTSTFTGELLSP